MSANSVKDIPTDEYVCIVMALDTRFEMCQEWAQRGKDNHNSDNVTYWNAQGEKCLAAKGLLSRMRHGREN